MTTAVVLILLGTLNRVVPHPPNAVALGALALYAGARLPRRWALVVPIAAMVLSDLYLDRFVYAAYDLPFFNATRIVSYATFAAVVLLGRLVKADAGPWTRCGMSLSASALFFLTTNFAVWATSAEAMGYPKSLAGLGFCYVMALPFLANQAVADLVGTGVLFGLDGLAHRLTVRRKVLAANLD